MIKTEGIPFRGTDVRILDSVGNAGRGRRARCGGGQRSEPVPRLSRQRLADAGIADRRGGYKTGDLGYLDDDGHFIYGGRSKDIIRRGGVTLVPAEIEAAILKHPAINEVAVVPLPDDRLGRAGVCGGRRRAGE